MLDTSPELIQSPFNSNPFGADVPGIASMPGDKDYRTIGWCEEVLSEDHGFLKSQKGYDQIDRALDAIIGENYEIASGKGAVSRTRTNRVAQCAEDIAADITDTDPFWEYQTANRRFEQHASAFGKLATNWYQGNSGPMLLASIIKYSLPAGTGYGHLTWNANKQDLDLTALDPRNALCHRPTNFDDIQSSMAVTVQQWMPVGYIKQKYGVDVKAEADSSPAEVSSGKQTGGLIAYLTGNMKGPKPPKFPVAALKIMYLTDPRKNERSARMAVGNFENGKEINNWSYIVQPGDELWPNKRMIVWVGNHLLYDGPNQYWHGQFPVLKFTISPWPWSFLGKAPLADLLPLNDSLNGILRVIDNHCAQVANPGSVHDKNSVSQSQFNQFDTTRPGYKIMQNPMAGKGIQIINPPPLDAAVFNHRDWLGTEIRELGGVTDFAQLAHLNQLPSNDSLDTIMGSMTARNRYRSRIIESFIGGRSGLAMQLAFGFSQYYTLPMRCQILGPGGVMVEDYDYDPKNLLPAYPHDNDVDSTGSPLAAALARGPLPRYERAKEFMQRFAFKIAPSSFLNSARVQDQLMRFQLFRAGVLDVWTLWEALGIPNTGILPDNVRTIPERLAYQQQIGLIPAISPTGRKATAQDTPRLKVSESG